MSTDDGSFSPSTANDCIYCFSKQTVVKRVEKLLGEDHITHMRYCNMCRRATVLWEGTRLEERKKRARQRVLAHRARLLDQQGSKGVQSPPP